MSAAELALDDQLREVLVGQPLAGRPPRVRRRGEGGEDVVVEEVGERPVADVVEEPGDPERLDDEALATGAASPARRPSVRPQRRVERPAPRARPRA